MNTESPIIGIYHKNCVDGTASAAVLSRKFPKALLIPLSHGHIPNELQAVLEKITPETIVYTLDCAIGVNEALAKAKAVVTLDHHESAQEELQKLTVNPKFTYVFDNDKSGATVAWTHLFPDEPVPEPLKLVEDVDLWRWQFGNRSKNANYALSTLRNDPFKVAELLEPSSLTPLLHKGATIAEFADDTINRFVEEEKVRPVMLKINDWTLRSFNSTVSESEIANKMLEIDPSAAVIIFRVKNDHISMSIRSADGSKPNALEAAQALGGGGHKNASGARISLEQFWEMIQK